MSEKFRELHREIKKDAIDLANKKSIIVLDRLPEVSKWILAGTLFSIYSIISDIEKLKLSYSGENLSFLLKFLCYSAVCGIAYIVTKEHDKIYDSEFITSLQKHPKREEMETLINQLRKEGFDFGIKEPKNIYDKEIPKHFLFLLQLIFFTWSYSAVILEALKNLK
ncbi:MAG: hypothetical protein WC635_12420 [Bacteriovorax sp.]|jgi:hypothetical protein